MSLGCFCPGPEKGFPVPFGFRVAGANPSPSSRTALCVLLVTVNKVFSSGKIKRNVYISYLTRFSISFSECIQHHLRLGPRQLAG